MNELLFILLSLITGSTALIALYFGAATLTAFVVLQCVLANFFVIKQITIFGLTATCSDAYTIGATIGLNLLQEYYGKKAARTAIWANFFLLFFYSIVSQFQLWYIPNIEDISHSHFVAILSSAPRIIAASFTTFLLTQLLDYRLYGYLKYRFKNRLLLIRNYASVFICQFIDTVLFTFLGLYGIIDHAWEIITVSYAIKIIAILLATPLVAWSKQIYRMSIQQDQA